MTRFDQRNDTVAPVDNSVDRNPFTDWLQNIFGRPPPTTEKPISLDPPERCDECSEYETMYIPPMYSTVDIIVT